MVRSLQQIPEFDKQKVMEWFKKFDKVVEFGWSSERWVGKVAKEFKGGWRHMTM